MRIVQISNQKRNFRVFQVCTDSIQPDFSIYKQADSDNSIRWADLSEKNIKDLIQSAYNILEKNKSVHAQVLFELLNGMGAPSYLIAAKDSGRELSKSEKTSAAQTWLGKLHGLTPAQSAGDKPAVQKNNAKFLELELIRIQIAKLEITNENEIILKLVEKTLNLTKDMLASLTQTGLAQLEAIFNSNIVNATPKMVKRNVEIIQQQILNKTNIQMPDSFFDLKTLMVWFMDAVRTDTNYLRTLDSELQKIAKVYATNRLSTIKDEKIVKENIASVIPAFSAVFKIVYELGIEQKKPEDIIRSTLLSPIKNLEVVWPNWKSDIGSIAIPGKGVVGMLKSLYGKEAEQSGWLSKGQYIEIKLKFNESLTNLIKSATQYVCQTKQQTCSGFETLMENIDTPKFLYNVENVAQCFKNPNNANPLYSPGSFDSARSIVKACTSFHPDVKINESKIGDIVDTLLLKCVQWGQYKENKQQVKSFPKTKGKDIPVNQYTFDPSIPKSLYENETQSYSINSPDDVSTDPDLSTDTSNIDEDESTVSEQTLPQDTTIQQNTGNGWDNPETILFASQILFVLTQFSL